jgi:hypothetical protein
MKIKAPMYEGDSLLRYRHEADEQATATPRNTTAILQRSMPSEPGLDAWKVELRARRLRSEYIWSLMSALADRLDGWLARARQREQEAYLAKAQDHGDLERRLRVLERSGSIG